MYINTCRGTSVPSYWCLQDQTERKNEGKRKENGQMSGNEKMHTIVSSYQCSRTNSRRYTF